jgi:hypothetical protein
MEHFKASTQYGDWEGTSAADEQPTSIRDYLKKNELMEEHEFLLAVTLYVGEHGYATPFVRVFLYDKGKDFESVRDNIKATKGPIPVRSVELKLTTEEFLEMFKRFDVMLTWHGLGLEERDFVALES